MKSCLITENLKIFFPITGGVFGQTTGYVRAVNGVSLYVNHGELVAVVGESGCGKSTLGLGLLGLVPITEGSIVLDDKQIEVKKTSAWQPFRNHFQIIFQDPFTSLNPRHTIYSILSKPLLLHKIHTKSTVREAVFDLIRKVGLSPEHLDRFPHEFSGGQRQRIAIARAIGVLPHLIVCDEVVSALDVSVQAQIVKLLLRLRNEMQLSLLFITHDLSLVRAIADRVYVMYLGKIVESGPTEKLFCQPHHHYTRALLEAIPTLDRTRKPVILSGDVPSPVNLPLGCVFQSRCPNAKPLCSQMHPDFQEQSDRRVACHFPLQ